MKKTYKKALVVLASLFMVVAISAVGYAAWLGSNREATGEGELGTIELYNLSADAAIAVDGGKLIPIDQPGAPEEGSTKFLTVTVTVANAAASYKLSIKTTNPNEIAGEVRMMAFGTQPASATDGAAITWDDANFVTIQGLENNVATTGNDGATHQFYLFLVSDDDTDMGKTFNFTVQIAPVV